MNFRQIVLGPQNWGWNLDGDVWVRCPDCNRKAYLEHEISDEGLISPSLQCAQDGCDFHESGIRLSGYARRKADRDAAASAEKVPPDGDAT